MPNTTTPSAAQKADTAGLVYKGVGPRFAAIVIDTIILAIVLWIFFKLFGRSYPAGCNAFASVGSTNIDDGSFFGLCGGSAALYVLFAIAYYLVLEWLLAGTPGKLILGMKIVKEDGQKMNFLAALIRNVLRAVYGLFFFLVAAILIWKSDKKQRLGDRLAKTVVVARSSVK